MRLEPLASPRVMMVLFLWAARPMASEPPRGQAERPMAYEPPLDQAEGPMAYEPPLDQKEQSCLYWWC
jgi:hypothetical protein